MPATSERYIYIYIGEWPRSFIFFSVRSESVRVIGVRIFKDMGETIGKSRGGGNNVALWDVILFPLTDLRH